MSRRKWGMMDQDKFEEWLETLLNNHIFDSGGDRIFERGARITRTYFEGEIAGFREHNCRMLDQTIDYSDKIVALEAKLKLAEDALEKAKWLLTDKGLDLGSEYKAITVALAKIREGK